MALSTTCSLYWVDVNDDVVEVDNDSAVCDSTYISCNITGSDGGTLQATCNSEQQYPDTTSDYYSSYFCTCHGNSLSVPSGVTCSPSCYDLTTQFPTCNLVWLYDGFTGGSASIGVKTDTCSAFRCDSNGIECTDSSAKLLYQCDNEPHDSQDPSDSTDSYVCNCRDAAQIPEQYRGSSGASVGSGCSGNDAGGGSGTGTTTQPAGAGTATSTTASVTSSPSPTDISSTPGTTTADSQGSASSKLTLSRGMLLSLFSSIVFRLLYF